MLCLETKHPKLKIGLKGRTGLVNCMRVLCSEHWLQCESPKSTISYIKGIQRTFFWQPGKLTSLALRNMLAVSQGMIDQLCYIIFNAVKN